MSSPQAAERSAPSEPALIELENITKTFVDGDSRTVAVNDVSLRINRGDIFGIIGFSGAGKSTLVRCVNLLERPEHGKVLVGGKDLTQLSARELRHERTKIGMIFQHFNLLPSRTVAENVAYPLRGSGLRKQEIREKVAHLLDLVGIGEKAGAHPGELSGGQKQRVAIARALANDPEVLLCDEATSALDPQTTQQILELLASLQRKLGLTILVITHEMAVVKQICNKVAVMESGKVIEQGDILQVFTDPQEEVTQNFIRSTSQLTKAERLIAEGSPVTQISDGELIVRLRYRTSNVSEPIVSGVSRRFGINLNIIFADVEIVAGSPVGGIVAIVSGPDRSISTALAYLRENNIGTEVLKDARLPR
ncbi:methionine ABC transporter ATP-binding protein [Actinobaculum suis]|uniref:methionine ABC transporter ATP-binding protein n=1 Tax=Actinobaculum suis TaxID=1657 RepID=UPI00066FB83F|nr:ATP-binding cassette domain-containing protein [Actinobaculum suis]KMY23859.1 methionine ABC transporter ATP-binding protein [Actinobaculum suis]OCA93077.1 methionine ABC transporter ATP-binding protein [Actinobaculum suis]OCA93509.1 methionine ABC transporter ATP-binding protein [Actinobaculum suis]